MYDEQGRGNGRRVVHVPLWVIDAYEASVNPYNLLRVQGKPPDTLYVREIIDKYPLFSHFKRHAAKGHGYIRSNNTVKRLATIAQFLGAEVRGYYVIPGTEQPKYAFERADIEYLMYLVEHFRKPKGWIWASSIMEGAIGTFKKNRLKKAIAYLGIESKEFFAAFPASRWRLAIRKEDEEELEKAFINYYNTPFPEDRKYP